MRRVDAGDSYGGLVQLAEATRLMSVNGIDDEIGRLRFAAVESQLPRLHRYLRAPGLNRIAVSSDGRKLVLCSGGVEREPGQYNQEDSVQLVDLATDERQTLPLAGGALDATFSPDGAYLLLSSSPLDK